MAGLAELGYTPFEADRVIATSLELEKRMSAKEFDDAPATEVVRICRLVNNSKITSRFLERWVARATGADPNPQSLNGNDAGDLLFGNKRLGLDNAELKATEKVGRFSIGGGQLRFFEDIPYYIFLQFQQDGNDHFDLYLLSKQEMHDEIFEYQVCRCSPSQVSGQTKVVVNGNLAKMDDDQVRELVQESFDQKNKIVWGFGIDSQVKPFVRKEPKQKPSEPNDKFAARVASFVKAREAHQKKITTLSRWQTKYKITLADLAQWTQLLTQRYGI